MRKHIEWEWEQLDIYTRRAKVIGGWIVNSNFTDEETYAAESLVFIPDRDHEWTIKQPEPEETEVRR